ncbi:hypothetical protein MESS2_1570003 [Mesorhizobium metallidurans STM 2683]|uniref:Uncharacterized protein n=1 Tax=Mesorhizobium metallidurans STM 2683 TaxID=1297569 RepID=M5EMP4_9HYPH|nr:hypothetical protein MESS2_1570003 [Mesorhizobium metallidurans STM 2683]
MAVRSWRDRPLRAANRQQFSGYFAEYRAIACNQRRMAERAGLDAKRLYPLEIVDCAW